MLFSRRLRWMLYFLKSIVTTNVTCKSKRWTHWAYIYLFGIGFSKEKFAIKSYLQALQPWKDLKWVLKDDSKQYGSQKKPHNYTDKQISLSVLTTKIKARPLGSSILLLLIKPSSLQKRFVRKLPWSQQSGLSKIENTTVWFLQYNLLEKKATRALFQRPASQKLSDSFQQKQYEYITPT